MKRLFFFCIVALIMAACTKNEVRLDFDVAGNVSTPFRVLFYESDPKGGGEFRETVGEIRDGKGKFRIKAASPTIIFLYSTSGKRPAGVIYASPGEVIKIKGEGDDISQWKVEGNETSEKLSAWHMENAELLRTGDKSKINGQIDGFIGKNRDSAASAILLYLYFDRRADMGGFLKLEAKINKELLADPDLAHALSLADHISGLQDFYSVPSEIVAVGDSGFADTLRLNEGSRKLLIFRNSSSRAKTIYSDSIERFIERHKKITVAEFYADTDSSAWRRELRRDTIQGLRRFWFPLGLADSLSISMGVKRLPYLMVVDTLLKVHYRGDDWDEAVRVIDN